MCEQFVSRNTHCLHVVLQPLLRERIQQRLVDLRAFLFAGSHYRVGSLVRIKWGRTRTHEIFAAAPGGRNNMKPTRSSPSVAVHRSPMAIPSMTHVLVMRGLTDSSLPLIAKNAGSEGTYAKSVIRKDYMALWIASLSTYRRASAGSSGR